MTKPTNHDARPSQHLSDEDLDKVTGGTVVSTKGGVLRRVFGNLSGVLGGGQAGEGQSPQQQATEGMSPSQLETAGKT